MVILYKYSHQKIQRIVDILEGRFTEIMRKCLGRMKLCQIRLEAGGGRKNRQS